MQTGQNRNVNGINNFTAQIGTKCIKCFSSEKYGHLSNCLIVDYDRLLTLHIQIINGDKKYINKYDK